MRADRLFTSIILLLIPALIHAQISSPAAPDMATGLRSSGKIYVVVLVLATIFAGIIAFLIYLERKLARIEREAGQ